MIQKSINVFLRQDLDGFYIQMKRELFPLEYYLKKEIPMGDVKVDFNFNVLLSY
jgi:hypothetical protein